VAVRTENSVMQLNRGDGEAAIGLEVPANQTECSHDSATQSQNLYLTVPGPCAHLRRSCGLPKRLQVEEHLKAGTLPKLLSLRCSR
jgi:hypothetical protein